MNSFERYDAILGHRKPGKMPLYIPTVSCTVASEILGRGVNSGGESLHFKEELSFLAGDTAHDEFVRKYQEDAIELNRKLKADIVRQTWRSSQKPSRRIDKNTILFGDENGPHVVKRFFPEQQSYGIIEDTTCPRDVDELALKLKNEMKQDYKITEDILFDIYKDHLEFKRLADPYFPTIITGPGMGIPIYNPVWLEATALEPDVLVDYFLYQAEKSIQHIGWIHRHGFRFVNGGADVASNTGPVYSPTTFKNIMIPAYKKIADECNKYGIVYCYRSDGCMWPLADYLFKEAGIQAYGEVDRDASMTVGKIREKYQDLIILGNISSATLQQGTEQDVRNETSRTLIESGGYNYIPGPSNAIMHRTPVENIYAMIDEIEKFRP